MHNLTNKIKNHIQNRSHKLAFIILLYIININSITIAQDTIVISKDLPFLSGPIKYNYNEDFSKVKDEKISGFSYGYLIIQIDSNTKREQYYKAISQRDSILCFNINPTIYLMKQGSIESEKGEIIIDSALEKLQIDSCRIYDVSFSGDLIRDGYHKYLNGDRDDLSTHLYYLNKYGVFIFNSDESRNIYRINNTDILNNRQVWTRENSKIKYIIIAICLDAFILKFRDKNIFIPESPLRCIKEPDEKILLKQSFKKSDLIIIVK